MWHKMAIKLLDYYYFNIIYSTILSIFYCQIKSGYQLPKKSGGHKDIIDPYVVVDIFGIPADQHKIRTKIVQNNGNYSL